jgi:hypothetical protein
VRADLDVHRYFGFPKEVREAFDDWAFSEGINLSELRVRAVRLGEGVLECERYVYPYEVVRGDVRTEWHTYPVKTVPPLEMFTEEGFVGRLIGAAGLREESTNG